jgi:hypothetical protein
LGEAVPMGEPEVGEPPAMSVKINSKGSSVMHGQKAGRSRQSCVQVSVSSWMSTCCCDLFWGLRQLILYHHSC